jgi:hypothetical protein
LQEHFAREVPFPSLANFGTGILDIAVMMAVFKGVSGFGAWLGIYVGEVFGTAFGARLDVLHCSQDVLFMTLDQQRTQYFIELAQCMGEILWVARVSVSSRPCPVSPASVSICI